MRQLGGYSHTSTIPKLTHGAEVPINRALEALAPPSDKLPVRDGDSHLDIGSLPPDHGRATTFDTGEVDRVGNRTAWVARSLAGALARVPAGDAGLAASAGAIAALRLSSVG